MRSRLLIAGTAAAIAAAVLSLGDVLRHAPAAAASDALPATIAAELEKGSAAGDTQAEIAGLQGELRLDPHNAKALDTLGLAYQQRARETADPTYYGKADGILHEALRVNPGDLVATAGLGQLALSRHQFRLARSLGLRAKSISPTTAGVYGVIGDADIELGRYPQAFAAFDRMNAIKPDVSSYARVSYARELLGDTAGALRAMRLAASAAIGEKEASSWTHVQVGLLLLNSGHADAALEQMREALTLFPGYYFALDGLAQAEAGLGNLVAARGSEQRAVSAVPLPQYVGLLGDLEQATGEHAAAQREYALIPVIQKLLAANGVRNDLDIALFNVDHGIDLPASPALARRGYHERPSILGDDVLAWALARNGDCRTALSWSKRALRLHTQDPVKLFHRGYIEACLGHTANARTYYAAALALNPHFSLLWAPVARKGIS